MPGFNRWLNGKNRQIRQGGYNPSRQVYGTPTANPYADPAGPEIDEEAIEGGLRRGRPARGGSRYSGRPARVATGYGGRVTRRFG